MNIFKGKPIHFDTLQVPKLQHSRRISAISSNSNVNKQETVQNVSQRAKRTTPQPQKERMLYNFNDENINGLNNDFSETLRKKCFTKVLEKAQNSKNVTIHRKIIEEKLSTQPKIIITSPAIERNLSNKTQIIIKEKTQISSPNSSTDSNFNIWDTQHDEKMGLFDLYQQRYQENEPIYNISEGQMIKNIKSLLGQNLKLQGLGLFPWYIYNLNVPKLDHKKVENSQSNVASFKEYIQSKQCEEKKKINIQNIKPQQRNTQTFIVVSQQKNTLSNVFEQEISNNKKNQKRLRCHSKISQPSCQFESSSQLVDKDMSNNKMRTYYGIQSPELKKKNYQK